MSKICDSSLITPFILRLMIQETMLQLKNWPVTAVPASNYRSSKSTGHAVILTSFTADVWEHRSFSLPTCVKIMLGDVCKVSWRDLCLFQRYARLNTRPAGVFGRTRSAGGGGFCPLPNSRTRGRSEVGEAANECSWWILLKQLKKILKGHLSGQCQVKGQNRHFWPNRLLRRD